MKNITVIGSGISGLSIARMLSAKYQVNILEKAASVGGLIKCERVNGVLFHRVGGHVFNSRNQEVLDWFWQHFDRENEFLQAKRNAKILMNNAFIGYPLENYLYQLPAQQVEPIITQLLDLLQSKPKKINEYANFKEFLIGNFGQALYDLYFGPYNSKIWNTDISKVPLEWLDGKLPMPHIKEVIISNIIKKEETNMVHSLFYYPKTNGSQFIINRLAENQNIEINYTVAKIECLENKKLKINDSFITDAIVYTGDIRKLNTIIHIEDIQLKNALNDVIDLPSNGTSNVLCETDSNDISWLYLPENKFKAHRIIYTGNFSDSNNQANGRKTCVVEFSGKPSQQDMLAELQLLPGNLTPIAFNYEPNSYIIQHNNTRSKIASLKTLLAPYHIYLLGRFAEWEYHNMDKCIESAMQLNQTLKC